MSYCVRVNSPGEFPIIVKRVHVELGNVLRRVNSPGEFPVIVKWVHVEHGNVLRSVPFTMFVKEVSRIPHHEKEVSWRPHEDLAAKWPMTQMCWECWVILDSYLPYYGGGVNRDRWARWTDYYLVGGLGEGRAVFYVVLRCIWYRQNTSQRSPTPGGRFPPKGKNQLIWKL